MTSALPLSSPEQSATSAGRVRAVALESEDRATLARLFGRAGVEVEYVDSVGPHGPADESVLAIAVWHRPGGETLAELVRAAAAAGARTLAFTAANDEATIVAALEAGARQVFRTDESERVTLARIEAALRRPVSDQSPVLRVAPFTFDLARRLVLLDGEPLDLSPKEFNLAYYLFGHRGRVVTNAELLTSVWSLPHGIDSRRIDTAVCRVRRKMHLGSDSGWVLRRFRREGYGLYQDSRDVSRVGGAVEPWGEERRGADDGDGFDD